MHRRLAVAVGRLGLELNHVGELEPELAGVHDHDHSLGGGINDDTALSIEVFPEVVPPAIMMFCLHAERSELGQPFEPFWSPARLRRLRVSRLLVVFIVLGEHDTALRPFLRHVVTKATDVPAITRKIPVASGPRSIGAAR